MTQARNTCARKQGAKKCDRARIGAAHRSRRTYRPCARRSPPGSAARSPSPSPRPRPRSVGPDSGCQRRHIRPPLPWWPASVLCMAGLSTAGGICSQAEGCRGPPTSGSSGRGPGLGCGSCFSSDHDPGSARARSRCPHRQRSCICAACYPGLKTAALILLTQLQLSQARLHGPFQLAVLFRTPGRGLLAAVDRFLSFVEAAPRPRPRPRVLQRARFNLAAEHSSPRMVQPAVHAACE
jgi:hypothetical protein